MRLLQPGFYIVICLMTLWGLPVNGAADEQQRLDRTRLDLESVQNQIESAASELKAKQTAAQNLLRQLRGVQQQLQLAGQNIRKTEAKLKQVKGEISQLEAAAAKTRTQISGLEETVRIRLIALYKGGDAQALKMLFSSQSPAELVENYLFMQLLVGNDRDLLTNYRSLVAVNEKRLLQLAELKTTQETTARQQTREKANLLQASKAKNKLLQKIRQDEVALSAMLAELAEKAERLSSLIDKLETEKPGSYADPAGGFADQKGKLDWPVKGQIQTRFGKGTHAELGTRYDSHGIEIQVGGQQPMRSVWGGQVVFANAFRGYGNLMIVDHGSGYYSLYAQAAQLIKNVGDRVQRGETIAMSGFDGGDTVYFEIRKGGTPEDPSVWLRD